MEHALNGSPVLKRKGGIFYPHVGLSVSVLYPVPHLSPPSPLKGNGEIDFTKAQERTAHSAVLEDSQFPSIDVVSLNSSGVDVCRGVVTAAIAAAGIQGTEVESLQEGWAEETLQKMLKHNFRQCRTVWECGKPQG